MRKGVVYLLSLLLLFALITDTLALSFDIAFSHPAKLEKWLAQSNFYNSFVNNAIKQAESATESQLQPNGGVSLNDVAVQQTAESAFTPALVQQDVDAILNSNYAWLEGKTATPNFSIDLSSAKDSFAQRVGLYVQSHLSSLPVCTTAQALSQPTTDPLSMTCRPAPLNPADIGAQVTQQLQSNNNFLSNTVITPSTINPNGNGGGQPYYQKLSFAPRAYRAAIELPWILGGLAIVSVLGIVFMAPRKRAGLRRIGVILLEAGLVLVVTKFISDIAFSKIEAKAFNNASVGPLQQSLTAFAHLAETQLVHIDLCAGMGLVVLSLAIIMSLIFTRNRTDGRPPKPATSAAVSPDNEPRPPASDRTGAAGQSSSTESQTPNKRPPRLIQ